MPLQSLRRSRASGQCIVSIRLCSLVSGSLCLIALTIVTLNVRHNRCVRADILGMGGEIDAFAVRSIQFTIRSWPLARKPLHGRYDEVLRFVRETPMYVLGIL